MATFIRVYSDTHLDFDLGKRPYISANMVWAPSALPDDLDSILILAGDLWHNNMAFKVLADGMSWISEVAKRFEHVIVVLGNHDYWGLSLQSAVRKAKEALALLPNVTLLEQSAVTLSGVKFVGGTLWTDYGRNPHAMHVGRQIINDFKYTTFGDTRVRRKLRPEDLFEVHRQTAKFIFNNCQADFPGQKVVVVTHMAPHELSIDPRYARDHMLNLSYYSDLSESVRTHCKDVQLWIHGHIHLPANYMLYNVHVMSNPRGYQTYEGIGTGYEPDNQLRIDQL